MDHHTMGYHTDYVTDEVRKATVETYERGSVGTGIVGKTDETYKTFVYSYQCPMQDFLEDKVLPLLGFEETELKGTLETFPEAVRGASVAVRCFTTSAEKPSADKRSATFCEVKLGKMALVVTDDEVTIRGIAAFFKVILVLLDKWSVNVPEPMKCVLVGQPSPSVLLLATKDDCVELFSWEMQRGEMQRVHDTRFRKGKVKIAAASKVHKLVAIEPDVLCVLDVDAGKYIEQKQIRPEGSECFVAAALTPTGAEVLVVTREENKTYYLDVHGTAQKDTVRKTRLNLKLTNLKKNEKVHLAVSPYGTRAVATTTANLTWFKLSRGEWKKENPPRSDKETDAAAWQSAGFSPDGLELRVLCANGSVRRFCCASKKPLSGASDGSAHWPSHVTETAGRSISFDSSRAVWVDGEVAKFRDVNSGPLKTSPRDLKVEQAVLLPDPEDTSFFTYVNKKKENTKASKGEDAKGMSKKDRKKDKASGEKTVALRFAGWSASFVTKDKTAALPSKTKTVSLSGEIGQVITWVKKVAGIEKIPDTAVGNFWAHALHTTEKQASGKYELKRLQVVALKDPQHFLLESGFPASLAGGLSHAVGDAPAIGTMEELGSQEKVKPHCKEFVMQQARGPEWDDERKEKAADYVAENVVALAKTINESMNVFFDIGPTEASHEIHKRAMKKVEDLAQGGASSTNADEQHLHNTMMSILDG